MKAGTKGSCLLLTGAFLMNIIGGRSSMYQLAGISTSPVSCPLTSGFIHVSALGWVVSDLGTTPLLEATQHYLLRIIAGNFQSHQYQHSPLDGIPRPPEKKPTKEKERINKRNSHLSPLIPRPQPIRLMIQMTHTMIILNPITKQQLGSFLTSLPPRRHTPPRRLPMTKLRQQFKSLIQHIPLLFQRHIIWIFVTVPVKPDFVSAITDHGAFLGERFEAVAWDEPRCFDVFLLEEGEETAGSYCAGEETFGRLQLVEWTIWFLSCFCFPLFASLGYVHTATYVVA